MAKRKKESVAHVELGNTDLQSSTKYFKGESQLIATCSHKRKRIMKDQAAVEQAGKMKKVLYVTKSEDSQTALQY